MKMGRWILGGLMISMLAACGGTADDSEPIVILDDDSQAANNPNNPNNVNNLNNANNVAPDVNDANNSNNSNNLNNANNASDLTPLPVLGNGSNSLDEVELAVVATSAEDLNGPRDLEFNPTAPEQLWIVNVNDNTTVVLTDPGTEDQSALWFGAPGRDHFMARPSALAFGTLNVFATAQETDEITQASTPADFMGPTLWSADLRIFDGGHGGHLDMLHNSPNGAGVAWETDNAYWIFDGYHESLTRYDFQADHGPGGADHSDGIIARYAEGEVSYVEDVPSHMEVQGQLLYVADTGNNRIATLDITTGEYGRTMGPGYDGPTVDMHKMTNTTVETLVDGESVGLVRPSGLEIRNNTIFVSDNATSKIYAFDLNGKLLDWLDLSSEVEEGGLMGLAIDVDGNLWAVDNVENRVLRISPK